MDNETTDRSEYDDEIDLRELFSVLWEGKLSIALVTALSAVIAVSVALYLPNKYTSEALLAPRIDGGAGGALGQLASQYGGLASLAGVNIGGFNEGGKSAIAIEVLKSREFFGKYLYESVLIDLMAADGWDRASNTSTIDAEVYDSLLQTWVREVRPELQVKPSIQEAHERFTTSFLAVSEDKQNGFVTVGVTHFSPFVARDWVLLMVNGVNDAVRARDVEEAENSIAFLNEQRQKTSLVYLTEVFAELIEQQTKTVMLASTSDEYVFQIIEPPVAPEVKSGPRRALICMLGVLLGGFLAVLYVLIRHYSGTDKVSPSTPGKGDGARSSKD
jgi:capsular polysaccharide biosynthesis protein